MDVGQMSAAQVELALERVQGGWDMLHELGEDRGRDHLLELEGRLKARQAVVGKPVRGVSLDVALCGDRDSLRQAIQAMLEEEQEPRAFVQGVHHDDVKALVAGFDRLREALRRSDELGGKWESREVEAVTVARQNEGLRFELTVAHGALKRIVEARDADGHTEEGECDACATFDRAINAAREIVGGGK